MRALVQLIRQVGETRRGWRAAEVDCAAGIVAPVTGNASSTSSAAPASQAVRSSSVVEHLNDRLPCAIIWRIIITQLGRLERADAIDWGRRQRGRRVARIFASTSWGRSAAPESGYGRRLLIAYALVCSSIGIFPRYRLRQAHKNTTLPKCGLCLIKSPATPSQSRFSPRAKASSEKKTNFSDEQCSAMPQFR